MEDINSAFKEENDVNEKLEIQNNNLDLNNAILDKPCNTVTSNIDKKIYTNTARERTIYTVKKITLFTNIIL